MEILAPTSSLQSIRICSEFHAMAKSRGQETRNTPVFTAPPLTSGGTCLSRRLLLSGHLDSSRQHIPRKKLGRRVVKGKGARGQGQGQSQPPRGRSYLISMARQVCGQFLSLHIPYLQCAVTAPTDQEPAVSRPGNLVYGSHVATQGSQVPEPGEARDGY